MTHEVWEHHVEAWDEISREFAHTTALFPDDTNKTCTFTCGGSINTFGSWVEIADNTAATLSTEAASYSLHFSSLVVGSASVDDKMYIWEIGYDSGSTITTRGSFGFGTKFIAPAQQVRIRADHIPAGETIVYRAKCETASATFLVNIRYHLHS